MSEPDELYTLRAQYWLGHYTLALDEGRAAARRPMAPHLKTEREELVFRCQLALGEYDKIVAGTGDAVALQALAIHALFLNTPPDDRSREAMLENLKNLLASPDAAGNTSVQLTACHVFLAADKLKEALECVHLGLTMEHLAMCVQIYLKIDRFDLANDALGLLKQADEDSILAQLASAYVAIASGRSSAGDAVHILAGLSEQYGPSLTLLNATAAANMVAANYEAAESNLKAAVLEFEGGDDADTLVNLVVCAQHLGKGKGAEVAKHLEKLKTSCKEHPFVQGLLQVEGAFDRESAKYLTA